LSGNARRAVIAVACALSALGVAVATAQSEKRTVRDGVFSAAQVARGQKIFKSICVNCHEIEDFTGPGAYLEDHDGKRLWEAFDFIRSNMPDDDPSSLEPAEYAAVLAYIFSVYGLPAGDADMPIDRKALELIMIERPLPAG
jgi:S-disulfanyl-L-cysteine oxidoreductase SoxD